MRFSLYNKTVERRKYEERKETAKDNGFRCGIGNVNYYSVICTFRDIFKIIPSVHTIQEEKQEKLLQQKSNL